MNNAIDIIPWRNAPAGYPDGAIDEIRVEHAGVTIQQQGKHAIALYIRLTGATRRFRFESVTPGKGPGICIRLGHNPPPGSRIHAAGAPDELATYNMRQANLHLEMMNPGLFQAIIDAGSRSGRWKSPPGAGTAPWR